MKKLLYILLITLIIKADLQSQVPVAYQSLYDNLLTNLTIINDDLTNKWNGTQNCTYFSSEILTANSLIQGSNLLNPNALVLSINNIKALDSMGVNSIRLGISYPTLVSNFPNSSQFLDFYQQVFQEARSRGMKILVQCTATHTNPAYGPVDPDVAAFCLGLTPTRYKIEKREMIETIIDSLTPDYLTIENEPTTWQDAIGLNYSVDTVVSYINYFLNGINKNGVKIGAGQGTWEPIDYLNEEVQIADLDYIDLHIYPIFGNFFDDQLYIYSDTVIAHNKSIIIGETWLHKTTLTEYIGGITLQEIQKRNVFSFWESIDSLYFDCLYKYSQIYNIKYLNLYWSTYIFGNRDYVSGDENLTLSDLLPPTNIIIYTNISNYNFQPVGLFYASFDVDSMQTLCDTITGISEYNYDNIISCPLVYPNPTNGIFTIEAENNLSNNCRIQSVEIANINGQIIYKKTLQQGIEDFITLEVDLSNKSKGIYFVKIIRKDKLEKTKKIIIQ